MLWLICEVGIGGVKIAYMKNYSGKNIDRKITVRGLDNHQYSVGFYTARKKYGG